METLFKDGEESSRAKLMAAFEALQNRGPSVLDDLAAARTDTLFRFQLGLSALNSRRQRAACVLSPDVACRFVMFDLIDVDQSRTSATLRPDAQAATLRERCRSASRRSAIRSFSRPPASSRSSTACTGSIPRRGKNP